MSQYLKELITDELKSRFDGVSDALLVDVIGMEVNSNVELRKTLREKNIKLMVVKNSLARRATEGSALAPAFEGAGGTIAVVWGGEDVVSLAKEVDRRSSGYFAFKEGTMYPALHRLERDKLVEGSWQDTPNGVRRRYYQITAKGRQALADRLREWQRFSRAMNSVMLHET